MTGFGRGGADLRLTLRADGAAPDREACEGLWAPRLLSGSPASSLRAPPPLESPASSLRAHLHPWLRVTWEAAAVCPPGFLDREELSWESRCCLWFLGQTAVVCGRVKVPVSVRPRNVLTVPSPLLDWSWSHCLFTQALLCQRSPLNHRSCPKPWEIIFNYKVTYLEEGGFSRWF